MLTDDNKEARQIGGFGAREFNTSRLDMRAFFTTALRSLIRGYQAFVSPFLPSACRYTPTCSAYALEAVEKHGPLKGSFLALKRVLRCNPFSRGGYDPVPDPK